MSLAFHSGLAGAAFFLAVGLTPVALYLWLAVRRRAARRRDARAQSGR